ncbi:hypothetical protein KAW65_08960 [candidate division WOR-3 bacterium]|nr:hypothetical protein [candidate division WOR-3 bacterium]
MEERLRIIKLLESGKITPAEAAKLLETLKGPEFPGRAVSIIKVGTTIAESVSDLLKEVSETVSETIREKSKEATQKAKRAAEKAKKIIEDAKKTIKE